MRRCTYTYYPGCALHSSAKEKEYDISAGLVREELDIKLREIEGWICSGASSAHSTSYLLSVASPAHELQTTEQMRLPLMIGSDTYLSCLKYAAHIERKRARLGGIGPWLG